MKKILLFTALLIGSVSAARAADHTVTVSNFQFTPDTVTAEVGDTITWVWVNGMHTTTAVNVPEGASRWNKAIDESHPQFSMPVTVEGTYKYRCNFHFTQGMVGRIWVTAPASPTPTATATATATATVTSTPTATATATATATFTPTPTATATATATATSTPTPTPASPTPTPTPTPTQAVLYTASGTGGIAGTLYTLDPVTGIATTVGPLHDLLGNLYGLTGLKYDRTTGIFYGATSGQSPTHPAWLAIVDPATALVTPIGPFLNDLSLTDIAIDPTTDIMYSLSGFDQHFFTITVATGEAVIIGSTGIGFANGGGFAADSTGALFGFNNFTPTVGIGGLYSFDKTSIPPGHATLIGPTMLTNLVKAADFSPSDVLYALEGGGGMIDNEHLRWLDTCDVTTGACTRGPQISVRDLDAIAFIPR